MSKLNRVTTSLVSTFLLFSSLFVASAHAEVDPWTDVSQVANELLGRQCTISTGIPRLEEAFTQSAIPVDLVMTDASMTCSRNFDEVALTVCIQVRQGVATEGLTWQDYRCEAPPPETNSSNASGSVSAACLTGSWAYRTKVIGEAHKLGSESTAGIVVTQHATYQCSPLTGDR